MNCRRLIGCAAALCLALPFARADVDSEDQAKGKEKGGIVGPDGESHEDLHRRLETESRENLKEIARLMELVRGDLAGRKTGEETQKREQDVIRRLQELIDKVGKG
jgi:hypothetical protein